MPNSPVNILTVDDEPSILSALRRLFHPEGWRVLQAGSGADGLLLLETETVDLVISDMRMPEMDGATFLEQVRLRWPEPQRVLLTGYADIGSTVAAVNRGEIHRYIAKPWDDTDLLLVVREQLDRRRLERQNRQLTAQVQRQNEQLREANAELDRRVQARTAEIEQVNAMLGSAYGELEQNFLLSLDVFAGLVELRERGAAGYAREVARLARRVAQHMQLSQSEVRDVFQAGMLHEVGKIALPDRLLRKPVSTMAADERALYYRHALAGQAALMPLAALHRAARLIRAQHERIDGQGGPDGLAGNELPVGAQIVSICIEFQGLVTGRLSERAQSPAAAAAIVTARAGSHYSVAVTQAFMLVLGVQPETPPHDRRLGADELQPGMVLSRDLLSLRGTLLLAAGFRFDTRAVQGIRDLVRREGAGMHFHVLLAPPAAPLPAPALAAGSPEPRA
ncbi:MAG: response regulator [Rubrivivax sp.]|nr:response regulator [Rubrivivax sp.]